MIVNFRRPRCHRFCELDEGRSDGLRVRTRILLLAIFSMKVRGTLSTTR